MNNSNEITYQLPMIFSSSTNDGAQRKSSDGSTFSVSLDRPILIPAKTKYCWVEVQAATIWNTVPNITTGVNDKFYFEIIGGLLFGQYEFTIEQSVYDVVSLNDAIEREITQTLELPSKTLEIFGDVSTQKVILQWNNISQVNFDFTQPDTFRELLGFDSQIVNGNTTGIAGEQFKADNVAAFNNVEYFLIHCDLVNKGLRNNSTYSQIIAQVLIDRAVGAQIRSTPFNPPRIPANELIGSKRNTITLWLTDSLNRRINTGGEDWGLRLVVNYI